MFDVLRTWDGLEAGTRRGSGTGLDLGAPDKVGENVEESHHY